MEAMHDEVNIKLLSKPIIFREAFLPTNRGFDSHYGYWGGEETYRWFHLQHSIVQSQKPSSMNICEHQ